MAVWVPPLRRVRFVYRPSTLARLAWSAWPARRRSLIGRVLGVLPLIPLLAGILAMAVVPPAVLATRKLDELSAVRLPDAPPGDQTTFVFGRDRRRIGNLHAAVNRTKIPGSKMPQHLRDAVVSIEDKDFYRHGGISALAIIRAGMTDLLHRRIEQGGSTITQQYVKNVYTGNEKSLERKVKEALAAIQLESHESKGEILTRYLNTVYFGSGAYGVEAAAQTYFGVPGRKLKIHQSAMLAALIPAPARYNPRSHPEAAKARRDLVLGMMAEQGYLTEARADRLAARPLGLRRPKLRQVSGASYFMDYVTRQLVRRYGYDDTFKGGLRVETTLDPSMQRAAERAAVRYLPAATDPSVALVAIDPRTGAIRALVGGRNFKRNKFNLAVQARRQTGSAFKTFALAAAVEQNIALDSIWAGPSSMVIEDPECHSPEGEPWEVQTYEEASFGSRSLSSATAASINTVYAQLAVEVGPGNIVDVARRMGIRTKLEPVCSIALGSQAVSPLEMTSAYATLAARGIRRAPFAIAEVRNASGDLIHRRKPQAKRTMAQQDADVVTHVLQSVVTSGTGTAAALDRPVAGKTGTAQEWKDAWFCGYVPQLAACVWVGYRRGEIPMHDVHGLENVYGGSFPAMIWHYFMAEATDGMKVIGFVTPDLSPYNVYPEGTRPAPPPPPKPEKSPSPEPSKKPKPPKP